MVISCVNCGSAVVVDGENIPPIMHCEECSNEFVPDCLFDVKWDYCDKYSLGDVVSAYCSMGQEYGVYPAFATDSEYLSILNEAVKAYLDQHFETGSGRSWKMIYESALFDYGRAKELQPPYGRDMTDDEESAFNEVVYKEKINSGEFIKDPYIELMQHDKYADNTLRGLGIIIKMLREQFLTKNCFNPEFRAKYGELVVSKFIDVELYETVSGSNTNLQYRNTGTLYLTSSRLVLVSEGRLFSVDYENISLFTSDWEVGGDIKISVNNRSKTLEFHGVCSMMCSIVYSYFIQDSFGRMVREYMLSAENDPIRMEFPKRLLGYVKGELDRRLRILNESKVRTPSQPKAESISGPTIGDLLKLLLWIVVGGIVLIKILSFLM